MVDSRDDDEEGGTVPTRTGRCKLVMFASGRTFLARCVSVVESADGEQDVAAMVLGAEIDVPATRDGFDRGCGDDEGGCDVLPSAALATTPATIGDPLFCVGNPSSVDLESITAGSIEFEPPTWHASVGACVGYLDPATQQLQAAQAARGRAPTRGERRRVAKSAPTDSEAGTYLQHSCWTYWGHSGAPLFDAQGRVVGLHCAWDDSTGMRHGQKLQHLQAAMTAAEEAASSQKR